MMTPAEAAKTLTGCFICGRNPIVAVGFCVPLDDATHAALMKLRDQPVPDDETPTVWYGLCRRHAQHGQHSAARVQAQIIAAAEQVVVN